MSLSATISSNALVMLGDQPISDLSEQNPRARVCSAAYAATRDALLRAHPWNCCTKRVMLPREADAPDFDFQFQFLRPSDWLRTLQVGHAGQPMQYRMEGRRILANVPTLPLVYIWRNEDEGSWDAMLVDLMGLALKAKIAYAITKSTSERDACMAEYARALRVAKAVDGQDDPAEQFAEDSSLTQARYGYRGL